MTTDETPAYGLWLLVLINTAAFVLFAFSFFPAFIPRLGSREPERRQAR